MTDRSIHILWTVVTFLAGAIVLLVFWLVPS
jgi:hypothetical protein